MFEKNLWKSDILSKGACRFALLMTWFGWKFHDLQTGGSNFSVM